MDQRPPPFATGSLPPHPLNPQEDSELSPGNSHRQAWAPETANYPHPPQNYSNPIPYNPSGANPFPNTVATTTVAYHYPAGLTTQSYSNGLAPYYQSFPSQGNPPGRYGAPPLGHQQQQQQTVIIGGGPSHPPVLHQVPVYQSYACHIVLACFVMWFCGCLFGLVAFILAVMASNQSHSDPSGSRQLGRASIAISIIGIVVTIIAVAVVVSLYMTGVINNNNEYQYSGSSCLGLGTSKSCFNYNYNRQ